MTQFQTPNPTDILEHLTVFIKNTEAKLTNITPKYTEGGKIVMKKC